MRQSDAKVFITGVSSGIGHALAREFLDRGATIYGLSRRTPEDLCGNDSCHFVSADLSRFDTIPGALDTLLRDVTALDLVVLNAGMLGTIADMRDTPVDDLRCMMDVNVWANKVLLDTLSGMGIEITQVIGASSGASVNGNRGWAGYALSKAALNMLLKLYASEMPETHFCALAPGLVDTAMQDYLCDEVGDAKFVSLEGIRAARNTSKMPTPEAVAPTLLAAFDKVRDLPSGSFADLRKL